jgi:hypothetical protein
MALFARVGLLDERLRFGEDLDWLVTRFNLALEERIWSLLERPAWLSMNDGAAAR